MKTYDTDLPGVLLIEPTAYTDPRGQFLEIWQGERYSAAGLPATFAQDNVSRSHANVLRGLHLQHPHGQGKLITAVHGEIFDVAVDLRRGSPTFSRWVGVTLSAANQRQLYIPEGFAHGFVVTGPDAVVTYKATAYYHAASDLAIAWDDPDIGIAWPVEAPTLSDRDRRAPRLSDLPHERLPAYGEGAG